MELSASHARAVARAGFIFVYPLVANYSDIYSRVIDPSPPPHGADFGTWDCSIDTRCDATASQVDGRTYCQTWVDLRIAPCILACPDRFFSQEPTVRCYDLWNFVVLGADSEDHAVAETALLVAPLWVGEIPDGVDRVVRGESPFLRVTSNAQVRERADTRSAIGLHGHPKIEPLSTRAGGGSPPRTPPPEWWAWQEGAETSHEVWACANFVLSLISPHEDDEPIMARLAELGIAAGAPWDASRWDPEILDAIEAGVDDALGDLLQASQKKIDPRLLHRSRAELDRDYFGRALGAIAMPP